MWYLLMYAERRIENLLSSASGRLSLYKCSSILSRKELFNDSVRPRTFVKGLQTFQIFIPLSFFVTVLTAILRFLLLSTHLSLPLSLSTDKL